MGQNVVMQIGCGGFCGGGAQPGAQKRATGICFFGIGLCRGRATRRGGAASAAGFGLVANAGQYSAGTGDRCTLACGGDCLGCSTCRRSLPRGGNVGGGNGHRTMRKSSGIAAGAAAAARFAQRLCWIFAIIWALVLFPARAVAEELPENAKTILADGDAAIQEVSGWQLQDFLNWISGLVGMDLQEPILFAGQAGGYLLLAGALALLVTGDAWRRCLEAVALLGFGTMSLGAMMNLADAVTTTSQDCQNYLMAFVPVYSGVAAMGGQSAGALVYSGMFFTMSGFLSGIIRLILIPVMQIYFCFTACACIWGNPGIEEAAALFAKFMHWGLRLCGIAFGTVLGLQNILAGSVDTAALKTGKSVLQGFIPVVGDAAAAALSGAAAVVQLLKGSLALAALAALAAAFVPVVMQCLLYTAAFAVAGVVASLIGQKQCGRLCRLYGEGSRLCASVLTLYFFMVFLSTALLLLTGNGG